MSANAPRIVRVNASVTAGYGQLILADATSGTLTVTLPRPSVGLAAITIKKTDVSTNPVNITRSGTALIDGATTQVLPDQFDFLTMVPDGTNWNVVASASAPAEATVPGAPTIGAASPGNARATVNFTPPVSNGGSAITSYTATSTPGGISASGAGSPIVVTGLVNGTAYTFKVFATNAIGNGPESAASNSVTPAAPVGGGSDNFNRADENPLVTSSGGQAWVMPLAGKFKVVSNQARAHGTPGSGYMALSYMETGLPDFTLTVDFDLPEAGEAGVCFRFVDADNYWRTFTYSGGLYLTKVVNGTPTNVGGFPSAPATGPMTFKVVCSGGSIETFLNTGTGWVAKHSVTGETSHETATKHGLHTGVAAFDLAAAYDNFVVTSGTTVPDNPTIGTAETGDTQAIANWTAPGSNGGSAITGYVVKTIRASDNVVLFTDTVGTVLTFTRTGLTNGVAVYFRVAAVNAIGIGPMTAASNTVTPAAFSPASVPNTVDWTEADQIAGPPADNTALASVTPSVGSHTYSQATGSKQPIFKSSVAAWNNKPVMRFARASSQEMVTAAPVLTALDNYTFIAVCSLVGTGAADAVYCNGNSAANGYSIFPVSGQAPGKVAELVNAIAWHDTNINATTTPTIIMVRRAGGVTRIWVNGVEGTVTQASDGPLAAITGSTRIGSSPSTFHDGDVAAVFAANASVSIANLNALGNYWAAKYGITWTTIT